jgi:preprotein translocase subunit Sec61beta
MPSMSAGLLRFFEEETEGIKIRPQIVVIMALALSAFALLAHLGVFPF